MDKEERIARLLASVEREEREQGLVERPTGAFVRELFLDSGEEDSGLNDDDDENEGEGEVPIEENDEYEEELVPEYDPEIPRGIYPELDFDDIEALPLNTRLKENTVSRINGKLAYITKKRDMLWDLEPVVNQRRTPQRNVIRMRMGCVAQSAREAMTADEVWKLYFTDEMINEITECTNIYINENQHRFSRERDAKTTNPVEVKAVIGLLYMAGVLKSSHENLEDLWGRDGFGVEFFRCIMSLKRFKFLLRSLRFDNILTREERKGLDKMAHIRDLFDCFVENCKKHFIVSEFVTVDEMLESFRGRCSFRQFMKSKPAKYGIKIYSMVCARTFYTANLEVYVGKQPDGPFTTDNSGKEVVVRMVEPISGTRRNVTVDNFFTSIPLCNTLLIDHQLTLVGTLRKNKREIPCEFSQTKHRPVGSSCFAFKKEATIVSYKAKKNKDVLLLSSMHTDDAVDMDVESKTYGKPEIILFYNSSKGGVDTVDKYKESYSTARITNRWSMRVFYSLLDIGALNAFIVLKKNIGDPQMRRRVFLKELSKSLCKEYAQSRLAIKSVPRNLKKRIREIMNIEQVQAQRPVPDDDVASGRCFQCNWRQNRLSKTRCSTCRNFICREHSAPARCVDCANDEDEEEMELD